LRARRDGRALASLSITPVELDTSQGEAFDFGLGACKITLDIGELGSSSRVAQRVKRQGGTPLLQGV
jgi:hypothetical protein